MSRLPQNASCPQKILGSLQAEIFGTNLGNDICTDAPLAKRANRCSATQRVTVIVSATFESALL